MWNKSSLGEKLDLASLLNETPKWEGLPLRPPENNCRPSFHDRQFKVLQQQLLHALRIQAHAYVLGDN